MDWSLALGELFKFLNNIISNPKKQVQKVINIYDTMHDVLDQTSVERCLIFKAHNGGGIIKPSGELYISALYEDYTTPFHSSKGKYQKVEVDEEFTRMLLGVMQEGCAHLVTNDMKDGLLKGLNQTDGIKETRIYFLGQTKKYIFFSSCATSREWIMDQGEKARLEMAMGKIKQNIK